MPEAGASPLRWAWLCAVLLCLLVLSGLTRPAQARTIELRDAQVTWTVHGQTEQQRLQLPYHWDRRHPGASGEATFVLDFALDAAPDLPYGLYLPRLGNAYEVRLNGALLQKNGDLLHPNGSDFAKLPRYVAISPGVLRASNRLQIRIRADVGRRGGLAPPMLGPEEEVRPLYRHDLRWRETGTIVVMILSLVVGASALGLWFNQVDPSAPGRRRRPRRDRLYLFAGVAELFWLVRVGDALLDTPPLAWPWWGLVPVAAMALWAWSMTLFCLEVAGWARLPAATWVRRWLAGLVLSSVPAAMAALVFGYPRVLTAWYALLGLSFVVFLPPFMLSALRRASLAHRMVAFAVLVNMLVGFRDLYVFRVGDTYADNTLMRYSSVVFGLVMGAIVIMRFRSATAQVRELMASMAERVARKEQELKHSYERVELLAREQARSAERARILRDMHDGVGAHIGTAIRQLQSGKATQVDVLQTLRDALDQLKLSIDAMHLPPGDINALLANLRYRLEPRFAACGLVLHWDVEALEPVPRIDDGAMRQLQFMLFEAISNVLQHAHADQLWIAARPLDAQGLGVRLQIIDNGRGFDTGAPARNGLLSMHERARAIGVALVLHSAAGRTVVEALIGVDAAASQPPS